MKVNLANLVKVHHNQINKTQNVSFIKDSHLQYSRIDPNKRFENFLIGSSNKIAFEASLKVSENNY